MSKKILFTGGGTGGHVYPALAVMEHLKGDSYDFSWLGSTKGMEKSIVEKWGIPYYSVPSGKLRRYFSFKNFWDIFKIMGGFFSSLIILGKIKPDLIFSKGGFVTVPPVLAAFFLRIPVFTHDSDICPGLATRINAYSAKNILVTSEKSKKYFPSSQKKKIKVTGNPIRKALLSGNSEEAYKFMGIKIDKPVVLILGGSSGAEQINKLVLENLDLLTEKYFIIHQTGDKNFTGLIHNNYYSVPYFNEELRHIYALSHLVISRAGASSVWEFAELNIPSILIPLMSGTRGEQLKNAELFYEMGSSRILKGTIDNQTFIEEIEKIMDNETIYNTMKEATKKISQLDGASLISNLIKEVI